MKKKNETKIIKFIKIYLEIVVISSPFIFLLGYVSSIIGFAKTGELNSSLRLLDIQILEAPKKTVFNQNSDGVIVLIIGFILFSLVWFAIKKLSDFIRNVVEGELISQENGKILKLAGVLVSCIGVSNSLRGVFINIPVMHNAVTTGLLERLLILTIGAVFSILHPLFVLGAFLYLLGIILSKAAIIKQENDLTV